MKEFVKECFGHTISCVKLIQNGAVVDMRFIVNFSDSPEEKVCDTLEEAEEVCKKHAGINK
jgi:hypothetical protein